MPLRMLQYGLEILHAYNEYPLQTLIYIGNQPLKMKNTLKTVNEVVTLNYEFLIINILDLEPEVFLEQNNSDAMLLAILTLKPSDPKTKMIIERIITQVLTHVPGIKVMDYLKRAELLVLLRKNIRDFEKVLKMFELDKNTLQESMLYQEGIKEGILKMLLELLDLRFQLSEQEKATTTALLNKLNSSE